MSDLLHRLSDEEHLQQRHGFNALLATAREACDRIEALEAENVRLREALRFYVAGCEWQDPPPNCDRPAAQCCKTAVAALKET